MIHYLHLSDLHLTGGKTGDPVKSFNQDMVTKSMLDAIRDLDHQPDFIIITGDLAQKGSADEYAVAEIFCNELLEAAGLKKDRLFIIPGNHDVDRREIKKKHIK